MRMTPRRIVMFWCFILAVGLFLYGRWASYSPAEKWLYVFEDPARNYAVEALTKSAANIPALPGELKGSEIEATEGAMIFYPSQDPTISVAFSIDGNLANDPAWRHVKGNWYWKDR